MTYPFDYEPPDDSVVLVVDDTVINLDILTANLENLYDVIAVTSGREALDVIHEERVDLILLDVMMPEMDGFQVLEKLQSSPESRSIPVILLTGLDDSDTKAKCFEKGAVDLITKPFEIIELLTKVKSFLALKYLSGNQDQVKPELSWTLPALLAARNEPGIKSHIVRIRKYIELIGSALLPGTESGINSDTVAEISKASILYEVGKAFIPDSIQLKSDLLTEEEFEIVKKHSESGWQVIHKSVSSKEKDSLLLLAAEIALTHHEKWDGSGYPAGLAGTDIPLSGRVVAVADVFDALISKRPHRPARSVDEAISIMREGRGQHFDPKILDCFISDKDNISGIINDYPI